MTELCIHLSEGALQIATTYPTTDKHLSVEEIPLLGWLPLTGCCGRPTVTQLAKAAVAYAVAYAVA